jgi:hypothetical protein
MGGPPDRVQQERCERLSGDSPHRGLSEGIVQGRLEQVGIEGVVGRNWLGQNDRAREPERAMGANDRRGFVWSIDPMLQGQSSRVNQETGELVGSVSDSKVTTAAPDANASDTSQLRAIRSSLMDGAPLRYAFRSPRSRRANGAPLRYAFRSPRSRRANGGRLGPPGTRT